MSLYHIEINTNQAALKRARKKIEDAEKEYEELLESSKHS